MASLTDLSLYFHVPFCTSKCHYCDFYSITGAGSDIFNKYIETVIAELEKNLEKLRPENIETIFIGGGTPSLLPSHLLNNFLSRIDSVTGHVPEITIEANPESLDTETLAVLNESAVNRISMGVQTYNDGLLDWLGRPAGANAVLKADRNLSTLWSGRLSRDILAALPMEGRSLVSDLESALSDDPGHLSLYELTIEAGTPLAGDRHALADLPEGDVVVDEWESALEYIHNQGYKRYEVSNFARPGEECKHNMRYWRMKPYLGLGPGAASTIPDTSGNAVRREVKSDLFAWLQNPADQYSDIVLSRKELILEYFMMGLRLSEGLSRDAFRAVFDEDPVVYADKGISMWRGNNYLKVDRDSVATDKAGMDLLDSILKDIVTGFSDSEDSDVYNWPALTVNNPA